MKDLLRLKGFIIEKAQQCVHQPEDKLKFQFVTPSFVGTAGADDNAAVAARSVSGHYLQMYDWDACFFSEALRKIDINGLDTEIIANFLNFQDNTGYIPRTLSPHRIWDGHDLAKPFFAQTIVAGLPIEANQRDSMVRYAEQIHGHLEYFVQHRVSKHGLYHWRNVLESGVDNNLSLLGPRQAAKGENYAVGKFPDGELLASDLNGYLVAEFSAFSKLANALDMNELALKYEKQAAELAQIIDELLWNEELGLYCNLDPENDQQVLVRSWTGLVPIFCATNSVEKIEIAIKKNILNEQHFLRPAGLSSLAASELLYNQAKRGLYGTVLVSNWQGPVWLLPNVLTVRCLLKNGYDKEARDLSRRVVHTMAKAFKDTGTLFENYNAETGEPLWAPDFMSWNALALELIELLE